MSQYPAATSTWFGIGCPRQGKDSERTVCPFGFLGFMHQIEQPIQLVEPFPTDQHVYYFFCHGGVDPNNLFKLKISRQTSAVTSAPAA